MFNYKKLKKYLLHMNYVISIVLLLYPSSIIKCQEKFLLTEEEMPGHKLLRQCEFEWIIAEGDQMYKVVQQKWRSNEKDIYIEYGEFNSEVEAIKGTAYASHTFATPFFWGSPFGSIYGDGAWVSMDNTAIFFVRGNVGIKINFDLNNSQFISLLSNKILNKIESNLSPDILSYENTIKQTQMDANIYQVIIEPFTHSELMNGYSLHSTWASKWVIDTENLIMGIRKEWKDANGSVIGIDICKFDSDSDASNASELMNRNTTYYFNNKFELDDLGTLIEIIDKWKYLGQQFDFTHNITVVGLKNNIAVHVYQYHPVGIDTEKFKNIVTSLGGEIINF